MHLPGSEAQKNKIMHALKMHAYRCKFSPDDGFEEELVVGSFYSKS